MINRFDETTFRSICDQLSAADEGLGMVIATHDYPPMWTRSNTFESLVHIILEQQVSLASALAALQRLRQRLTTITPEAFLELSDQELKDCYFSRQKMGYVRGLARELTDDSLDLLQLEQWTDDAVRSRLTQLKGIGNWTVDVYLMFVLQRADIFPVGDIAAVNALRRIRQLDKKSSREDLLEIAAGWKPYRTVATMILWHHYLSAPIKRIQG